MRADLNRFRMRAVIVLLIFAALFWICPLAWSEVVLDYELSQTSTAMNSSESKPEQKKSHKQVVLGDSYFSVQDGMKERIYDFKNRRVHYLDHQKKTRAEISLFADLAFRIAELQTRIFMSEEAQRSGQALPDNLYTLESLFGLEGEKPPVKLDEKKADSGKVILSDLNGTVAEITPGEDTPTMNPKVFGRFLIYDHSLHPLIRRRILAEENFPREFRYLLEGISMKDEFVVRLQKFEERADRGVQVPQNYRESSERPGVAEGFEDVDELIRLVRDGKANSLRHDQDWFWRQAQSAIEEKDYLNAAIDYMEYGLQSGDQAAVSEVMTGVAAHQSEDEGLDRFLRSLGIAGEEQARRAIEEIQKLDRAQVKREHMIDLVIANQKAVLRENESAHHHLVRALMVNPYLAGAYKDLGDLFYRRMDMATAWVCWDFARELAPEHFMLAPITDYEKELVETYPDFF